MNSLRHRVVAGDHAEHRRGIANVCGKRADAVKRGGKSDEAVARDAAIRGQHANHAAKTGRLANGAARIGAQRGHGQVGRHGRSRAAAGAAGNALRIDGIAHRPVGRVLIRRAHGKLVAVQSCPAPPHLRLRASRRPCIVGRPIALKNLRARRRRRPLHHHHILDTTGTPASGGSGSPLAAMASMLAACANARSLVRLRKTFNRGLSFSMRS